MTFLADQPVFSDAFRQLRLLPDEENSDVKIKRSDNWKKYTVAYEPDTAIAEKLSEFMTPPHEMGFCVLTPRFNKENRFKSVRGKGEA